MSAALSAGRVALPRDRRRASRKLTSDHKYLRICDLCQELGITAALCIIAVEQARQAKTDPLFGAFVPVN